MVKITAIKKKFGSAKEFLMWHPQTCLKDSENPNTVSTTLVRKLNIGSHTVRKKESIIFVGLSYSPQPPNATNTDRSHNKISIENKSDKNYQINGRIFTFS